MIDFKKNSRKKHLHSISKSKFLKLEDHNKLLLMKKWFEDNYEINSGQYSSFFNIVRDSIELKSVINNEFKHISSKELIEKTFENYDILQSEWVQRPHWVEIIGYQYDHIDISNPIKEANEAHFSIKSLLDINIDNRNRSYINNLLYPNVITVLETLLSDILINIIINDAQYFEIYLEYKKSLDKNFIIRPPKTWDKVERNKSKVFDELKQGFKIKDAKSLFVNIFDIKFPKSFNSLVSSKPSSPLSIRNDLVHRNGKNKIGKKHQITKDKISKLMLSTEKIANIIFKRVTKVLSKDSDYII